MSCNIGNLEQGFRIISGSILLLIGYFAGLPPWATVAVYVLGAVALITGAVRFCPLWLLLGVSTCEPASSARK